MTLAEMIAEAGGRQLHVAETEKYAHVTYFFNGGREQELEGEERRLVESPRDVPTYDQKPEMSAREAAEAFVGAGASGDFRFGIINFANPDMVGHTGVIPAAVAAVEAVDACLGDVVAAVEAKGGACIVTADHGNCDHMLEPDGSPNTAHSLNPVPLIVTAEGLELRDGGILADVAPTVLELLGIDQPAAMTGRSLIAGRVMHCPARGRRKRQRSMRLIGTAEVRDRRAGRAARAGVIQTAHGPIETPAFIPLATKGSVRGLESREVAGLGYQMILGNTYHLFVSPGPGADRGAGGLHGFMGWDRAMITDSGGFQVFSLAHGGVANEVKGSGRSGGEHGSVVEIKEEGVALPLLPRRLRAVHLARRPR